MSGGYPARILRLTVASIVACCLLAVLASTADAIECPAGTLVSYFGNRCVSLQEEEAEEHQAGAEEQREKEHAERKENGGPPSFLHVNTYPARRSSYRHPGHTRVIIGTDKWADVSIKVAYVPSRLRPRTYHFRERYEAEKDEWEKGQGDGYERVWSCQHPVYAERIEVRVRGVVNEQVEPGPGLLTRKYIVNRMTPKWCHAAKIREAEQVKRRIEAEERATREIEASERERIRIEQEESEAMWRRRFHNCVALGDKISTVELRNGESIEVCVNRNGNIIPWPDLE